MLAHPKKKRKVESSPVPVVASPESVVLLLKRVFPALRTSNRDEDEAVAADDSASGTQASGGDDKEKTRRHSRVNKPWARGRAWLAIGVNECTRLLGE
jgi:hypothetical protein